MSANSNTDIDVGSSGRAGSASRIVSDRALIIGLFSASILVVSSLVVLHGYGLDVLRFGEGGLGMLGVSLQIFVWIGVFFIGSACGHLWPTVFLGKMPDFLTRQRHKPSKLTSGPVSLTLQGIVLVAILFFLYTLSASAGHSAGNFLIYTLAAIGIMFGIAAVGFATSLFAGSIIVGAGLIYIFGERAGRLF